MFYSSLQVLCVFSCEPLHVEVQEDTRGYQPSCIKSATNKDYCVYDDGYIYFIHLYEYKYHHCY